MKANTPDSTDQGFDITPMIDIIFLLITFFMVVAAQITEKPDVDIPEASESTSPEDISGRMEVSINAKGELFVGNMSVTDQEFIAQLNERKGERGFRVFLRADSAAEHADVQNIMNLCAENGVFELIFSTIQ